jgi:hypothetical protein
MEMRENDEHVDGRPYRRPLGAPLQGVRQNGLLRGPEELLQQIALRCEAHWHCPLACVRQHLLTAAGLGPPALLIALMGAMWATKRSRTSALVCCTQERCGDVQPLILEVQHRQSKFKFDPHTLDQRLSRCRKQESSEQPKLSMSAWDTQWRRTWR